MDVRTVDLDSKPDPKTEVRLQYEDCRVSIWLPADAGAMGEALRALGEAGFDVARANDVP